jgi:GT2 family glycosyltransferase
MSNGKKGQEKNIDLSIIIINYNTKLITASCLNSVLTSLRSAKIKFEIILVDNASTDGSNEYFFRLFKDQQKIRLVFNKENNGFGSANNQAAKIAKGEYLLFLNSDTFVLNHAIEKLFAYYQKNESNVGFLGGKLLNKDFTDQPSAAYFFTLPTVFAALFLKGDYWGLTRFSPSKIKKVDWVSGAYFITKKEIFDKVGGFDEKIFMYMEEVDLMYRGKKMNYLTYFYSKSQIVHYGSLSSTRKKGYPIIKIYQGLIYFYKKHYSFLHLVCLKFLLRLKAYFVILVATIFNWQDTINTYKKALKITFED